MLKRLGLVIRFDFLRIVAKMKTPSEIIFPPLLLALAQILVLCLAKDPRQSILFPLIGSSDSFTNLEAIRRFF